jgi:hypothetical protein
LNQLKTQSAKHVSDIDEKISEEQETSDIEMAKEDRREMIRDRLMKEYQKQGKMVTQSELDEAVQLAENDITKDDSMENEESGLGEVMDVDAYERGEADDILGDGNYGDNVGETDD